MATCEYPSRTPDPRIAARLRAAIGDAPASYVDGLLRAIVGFELTVTKLEGKWKLSQNRDQADRAGVREGLLDDGHDALSRLMDQA